MGSKEFAKKVVELIGGTVVDGRLYEKESDYGVTVAISDTMSATVWMNDHIKAGRSPEWVAGWLTAVIRIERQSEFDKEQITDWERAKKALRIMLMHRRKEPEVCRSAAECGYDDLVLVPYLKVDIGEREGGTTPVVSGMLNVWNVSPKDCIDTAIENSRKDWEIRSMGSIMAEMMEKIGLPDQEEDWEGFEMLVVSNKNRHLGAVAEIFAREELLKRLGQGYSAIPSSRHEMLILGREQSDNVLLNQIVSEVNHYKVEERDRLSDHVYEIWE